MCLLTFMRLGCKPACRFEWCFNTCLKIVQRSWNNVLSWFTNISIEYYFIGIQECYTHWAPYSKTILLFLSSFSQTSEPLPNFTSEKFSICNGCMRFGPNDAHWTWEDFKFTNILFNKKTKLTWQCKNLQKYTENQTFKEW